MIQWLSTKQFDCSLSQKKSDIDLLVDFNDPKMSLFQIFRIQRELEKALGKKVDLVEFPIPEKSFLVINKVVPLYG